MGALQLAKPLLGVNAPSGVSATHEADLTISTGIELR